jgi:GTP-dependent phosphoenolpyruvate carboxykinase
MVEQRSGEKIIMQEDCSEDKIGSGYLTLTNQRLVFEKGEARMLTLSKKMTDIALDIPLNKIVNARTEGWLAKKVVVEVSEPPGTKMYKFGVFSSGKWRDSINAAIKSQTSSSM